MSGQRGAARERTPFRVLHVIPTLGPGGSERFVHDLTQASDRAWFEHMICVLGTLDAFPLRQSGRVGTRFLNVGVALSDPRSVYAMISKLRCLFREWQPDLIHSHLWHATRPTALAAVGTDLPHVVHLHDAWARLDATNLRDLVVRTLCNLALRRVPTRFIAVSEHTRDYTRRFVGAADHRTVVIPNGVNLARFSADRPAAAGARSGAPLVVAMVGWLEEFKGQALLIQALALLKEQGHLWRARFAGTGKMRERYIALAQRLDVLTQIEFCGLVEDVPGFLRAADVLVLPSATEGMPLCILEAMAMGLPVVASRVGGIPELIVDGGNGLLLAERSSSCLANALHRLADPELRGRLGAAARRTVACGFDLQRTIRAIEDCYRDVLQQRSNDDDDSFGETSARRGAGGNVSYERGR